MAAVNHCGLALRLVAEAQRSDRELVLAAIKNEGTALQYAPDRLRDDPEIGGDDRWPCAVLAPNGDKPYDKPRSTE